MFYTGYHPAIRAANPFFQYLSGTAPVCLFFYRLSIGIRTADHTWTMLAKFNVVAYGDGDVWSK